MSAYLVSKNDILYIVCAAMSGALTRVQNESQFRWYWHAGPPEERSQAVYFTDYQRAAEIANMLWRENRKSVVARYCDAPQHVGGFEEIKDSDFTVTRLYRTTWDPLQVIESIRYLEYQSCEHAEWRQTNAFAFLDTLHHLAVSALPGMEFTVWGTPGETDRCPTEEAVPIAGRWYPPKYYGAKHDGPLATFNGYPHLLVQVPNGGFTISARTSEKKCITFAFVPYRDGGPPGCVDVSFHNAATPKIPHGEDALNQQHLVAFGPQPGPHTRWDSRKIGYPVTNMTVLLDDKHYTAEELAGYRDNLAGEVTMLLGTNLVTRLQSIVSALPVRGTVAARLELQDLLTLLEPKAKQD